MIEVKIINKIGEKIEKYQENTGATKTWIAQQIGITKQTLNTIIKSQNPTIETIIKISVLLNCDISELYEVKIMRNERILVRSRNRN